MKKSILITITAALLLAAVLCTAGCVAPEDKIVGFWYTEDENGCSYAQFSPDKSAVFAVQKRDGTTETADAVWKAEGNSIYTVTLNGKDITCTLNAKRGVLDMNGVLYQKTVSPISGEVIGVLHQMTGSPISGEVILEAGVDPSRHDNKTKDRHIVENVTVSIVDD